MRGSARGKMILVGCLVICLASAGSALAGLASFTPAGYAGYASAGFTHEAYSPYSSDFYRSEGGSTISGTIISGVYKNLSTGDYLFYYNIELDAGSDAMDGFKISKTNMYTAGISAMGYNTDVTGANADLIPTGAEAWVPPPGLPYAKYLWVGVPAESTTEVFMILDSSVHPELGTGLVLNSISAPTGVGVPVYGPGDENPPIPEPATILLLGGVVSGLALLRKRS